MPTYQYTCTDCGEPVEAVQKFTDAPLTICAACGGRLRKVFSPVGIVFKGSGFYRTDSRNGSGSRSEASKDNETAKDKQPGESASAGKSAEPGAGGNGSAAKKAGQTVSASSKPSSSSSEKVA